MADLPIRQRSAHVPRPTTTIERACGTCGASFLGLAPGKTGERGLWMRWSWFCSIECSPPALRSKYVTPDTQEPGA